MAERSPGRYAMTASSSLDDAHQTGFEHTPGQALTEGNWFPGAGHCECPDPSLLRHPRINTTEGGIRPCEGRIRQSRIEKIGGFTTP